MKEKSTLLEPSIQPKEKYGRGGVLFDSCVELSQLCEEIN
jgi:hypothetical protein